MTRSNNPIDDELQFHIESRVRDLVAAGLSREAAAAIAEKEFGDRRSIGNECLDISRAAAERRQRRDYWTGWSNDLRYGARAIVRTPPFSIAAITILAIGIGLSSTVFAVVHGVFLNPLPYPHSRELHRVFAVHPAKGDESLMSAGDFFAVRDALAPRMVGAYMSWPVSLTGVPDPERLTGALVSADLFSTLGVHPIEGRTFSVEDENPSRHVAIISTRLAARLGLSGHAAGATVELGRQPTVILGVMPASFEFPQPGTDVWIPLALRPADRDNHSARYLHTIIRIDATSRAMAIDRLNTAMARLAEQFRASNAGWTVRTVPLRDAVIGRAGSTLVFLAIAIACVLLVMLVNLVTLVTSRLQRRTNELSVHQALGADRWRLMRQLGSECLWLTGAGGALGLLLTSGLVGAYQDLAGRSLPRVNEVVVSWWIIAFAVMVSLVGLCGMTVVPLWRTMARGAGALTAATRGAASPPRPSRALVVVQTAIACMLMITAGLLAQTYSRLANTDLGFRADGILTMRIALPARTPLDAQAAYFANVMDRVGQLPGVSSAGAVSDLPLSNNSLNVPIRVDQTAIEPGPGDELRAAFRVVTPGYLETIGARFTGRAFDARDTKAAPPVAMVNAGFARRHWPDRDPIGMRVRTSEDAEWRTVVGVVQDIAHAGAREEEGPAIYVPHAQKSEAFLTWMSLAIRSGQEPLALAASVRAAVATVDRYQPVSDIRTLDGLVAQALALPRLAASVAAAAAVGSLVLAGLGIAAVLSLLVGARTADFAVRLALGAKPERLKWTPVIECLTLSGIGCVAGVLGAAMVARSLRALLFGISPLDAATFSAGVLILAIIAVLAAVGPARAIARIDPTLTLRS